MLQGASVSDGAVYGTSEPSYYLRWTLWCPLAGPLFGDKKHIPWGLPWWSSDWESARRCSGHRFDSPSGRFAKAGEELNITMTEPVLWCPCSAAREATTVRSPGTVPKSGPCLWGNQRTPVHGNKDPAQLQTNRKHTRPLDADGFQLCPSLGLAFQVGVIHSQVYVVSCWPVPGHIGPTLSLQVGTMTGHSRSRVPHTTG